MELPQHPPGLSRLVEFLCSYQAQGEYPTALSLGFLSGSGSARKVRGFYPLSLSFPQVRKAAQYGVCSILRGSEFMFGDTAPEHHPAAPSTAKFCIQEIEKAGGVRRWSKGSAAECRELCSHGQIRT